jgi:PAS domain S-box-containing protein
MKFTPFRITLIYFIFAVVWITTTDQILEWMAGDIALLSQMQTAKGLFYISLTAVGLYLMMRSYEGYLSRSKEKLAHQEKSLTMALNSGKMGVWEYQVETDSYITSENHHELFGYTKDKDLKLEDVYKKLHPDFYDEFKKKEYNTLLNGTDFSIQYKVILDSGEKWLWTRGEPKMINGKVVSVSGVTIDITENKRLQSELAWEQELQKSILENIPVMITVYRPDISEFRVNSEFEKVTGWTQQSIESVDLMQEVYPDEELRREAAEFMMNPGTGWKDMEMRIRDGSIIQSSWTNVMLSDDTQIGIGLDITDRKNLELELKSEREELQKIFNSMPVFINMHNREAKLSEVNDYLIERLGYERDEVEEIDIFNKIIPNKEFGRAEEAMQASDGTWHDFELISRSGEILRTTWTNIRLSESKSMGIGVDITERIKLEEQVRREKEISESIISNLPANFFLIDKSGKFLRWNRNLEMVSGFSAGEISNMSPLDFFTDEEKGKVKQAIEKVFKEGHAIVEADLLTKSGNRIPFFHTGSLIEYMGEYCLIGTGIDISERKELEKKIEESSERLQLITRSANVGLWEWNMKTGETKFDEVWAWLVGYELEELQPISIKTWDKLVHPDDYSKFEKAVEEYVSGEKSVYECEIRMRHKAGHWVWILDRGRAVEWDDTGKPVRMVGTHIDISDRIAYEESLAYQASLLSNVSDAVISTDLDYNIKSWNNAAESVYGWSRDEVIGKNLGDFLKTEFEPGEDTDTAEQQLKSDGYWQGEVLQVTKDGERKNIFSSVTRIRDAYGNFAGVVAVNRDISERKSYEKEIRLLANVFLKSNTALAVSNHNTNKLERVNWAYAALFGYEEEEMVGMDIHHLYPADARLMTDNKVKELEKNSQVTFEAALKRKDESVFDSIVNLSLVRENELEAPYRISTVQDISELKKVQKQLVHERQRFELAANNVSDVVWEWNPVAEELWWGEGIETVMGYKKEEYEGDLDFWKNHIHEEDRDRIVTSMMSAETSDAVEWEAEYRFIAADGGVRTVNDSAVLIRDEKGELLRIIGAMVDITKLLEYQEALQRERNRFELIAKSSNDVLYDLNLETGTIWWSEGWQTRFGYSPDEVENSFTWWLENVHPEDKERINDSVSAAIDDGSDFWVGRYRIKNGEGQYRYVIDKGYFIKNENGKSVNLVGTISDITVDIEARENLKASEEQYRLLFQQSPLPMFIYDPETLLFISANSSAIEKYGYSEDELKKMKIYELHPESDYKEVKKEIQLSLKQRRTGFDVWPQIKKSGEKMLAEISGSEIYYEGKICRLIVANDITEQKKSEERAISAIVEGEERERQRVAKELHDGLGQYLSAANMNLETVYEDAKEIGEPHLSIFKNGLELLSHAISETRSISQNLLPKAIQDYGLELGIESLINQLRGTNSVKFYLYQNLDNVDIPDNIQINLYRVAQEAINNALRHGQPEKVNVQLIYSEGDILLMIEDDGKGFEPAEVLGGLGLQSMKTRAGAMSGSFEVISNTGKGTIISVAVPIQK